MYVVNMYNSEIIIIKILISSHNCPLKADGLWSRGIEQYLRINAILGHDSALERLYWAGDLG